MLKLTAKDGGQTADSTLIVRAAPAPPKERLDVVYTKNYSIDSPLWNSRSRALITNWIPHCIDFCERTDLREGQGGIDNFIEAGKALRGEPHARHKGYVFSNAWVHQTVESMCIALMVDPKGDPDMLAAQEKMRQTLDTVDSDHPGARRSRTDTCKLPTPWPIAAIGPSVGRPIIGATTKDIQRATSSNPQSTITR